jgi:hypothetical protein
MPTHNGGSADSEAIMDEAMLKAVQRLKQLIGKEPTTYPEDIIGINSLIMLLLHFQKKKGWEPKETYRQIELAAMPMHELQKLSREEYEKAMECREAARKAGFID